MSQINKYSVQKVQSENLQQEFSEKDRALIKSYDLGNIPFLPEKYQLNGTFYTLDNIYLETVQDLKTYTVLGANQKKAATEISIDPVQDALDRGYLGDIQIEYTVTNNLFSPSHVQDSEGILFIREISSDRTEFRATSTTLSENQLQGFAQELYIKLNELTSFKGVKLSFLDENTSCWCINVMTEVLDGSLIVTFKTYEPLPDEIGNKSRFTVLEQIGEPVRFEVIRTVEITEDERQQPRLKGPNFDVESRVEAETGTVTDYLNFQELFSYPESIRNSSLYSIYKEQGIELSIDHSDFSNFIHFSSAAERLENFRYKLGLIQGYQQELETTTSESEKVRLKGLIQGIIDNFDHYDRYLYFENTETSWPKESSARPYVNVSLEEATEWFEHELQRAQEYDEHNPDILINTIPQVIRLDSRNEPYLVFVHMIGQHFDEEWIYAKAVADRYNADNRLDFGISKDLVQEALRSFGIELETGNQNLERLFNLCVPGQPYNTGSEASVQVFNRITAEVDGHPESVPIAQEIYDGEYARWLLENPDKDLDGWYAYWSSVARTKADAGGATTSQGRIREAKFQPIFIDDYRKEVYKRIYHNIPLLLKTKGTSRGLRALISCFGIPEDLLEIAVAGGADLDQEGAFFGPEFYTTSSKDRIHLNNQGTKAVQMFDETSGIFISGTVLSLDKQIQQPGRKYQHGTNNVEVGFRLNGQFDQQVKDYLIESSSGFDYDNLIGDPRNTEEDYGEAFTLLRNQIVDDLRGDSRGLPIRTPSAILRLIRYYDSVLFRTLQSFVPARDVVSTGAIIDDNILHRNKYKGVEPEGKDLNEATASIETVFIDGGEAGSLKVLRGGRPGGKAPQVQNFVIRVTVSSSVTESRECPSVNYSEEMGQTIGSEYVTKTVFDDSPRFNGELAGTEYEITDGELNSENIFKVGGSVQKVLNYLLDYRFLCLPRVPIDTILKAAGEDSGLYFPVETKWIPEGDNISVAFEGKTAVKGMPGAVSTKSGAEKTILIMNQREGFSGGWVFATRKNLRNRYINYVGADPEINQMPGSVRTAEKTRILESISSSSAILLPAWYDPVSPVVSKTSASLDYTGSQNQESLWGEILTSGSRTLYPRIISAKELRESGFNGATLRVEDTPEWFNVSELKTAADLRCFRVDDLNGEGLSDSILNNLGIQYIYLCISKPNNGDKGIRVIDCNSGNIQNWRPDDNTIWCGQKYLDDSNDLQEYLKTRYLSNTRSRRKVIGILIKDRVTGRDIQSGSLQLSDVVLLEPYMGSSCIFTSGLGKYREFKVLHIEDWD